MNFKRNPMKPQRHVDRIPSRPGMCAAWGCPLAGTRTRNTAGAHQWWCSLHYEQDADRFQAITAELRRLDWLVKALSDLRDAAALTPSIETLDRIARDFRLAQRNDLLCGAHESAMQWLGRLEFELSAMLERALLPVQVPSPCAGLSLPGSPL